MSGVGTQAYGDYADPSEGSGASYGYTPQGYDFSQQGYAATPYDSSLQSAITQFYQQNPSAPGNPNAQPAASSSTTGSTAAAPTNALQPSYIPTPPTAQATTYNPATYNAATTGATGYNAATYNNPYDPSQATSELQSAAGVQDQSQNSALMSMLAAQGISPGSSAAQAALQNLSGAQGAALDPSLAAVQENAAGLGEQSGLANASAINSAGQFGASASNTAGLANQSALNTAGQTNAGALNTAGQYNAGANNTMTSQNLQDLLQQQEYNSGAYNAASTADASYQNQDWLAQLNAQLGLQNTGLQGSNQLAGQQANQQVPLDPSLFSQITSGVGAAAQAAAPFSGSFGGGGTSTFPGANGVDSSTQYVAAGNAPESTFGMGYG